MLQKRQGDVRVRIKIGNNGTKKDLWRSIKIRKLPFVPELESNLLSCSDLCLSGYDIKFKGNSGRALMDGYLELQCYLEHEVYATHANPDAEAGNVALAAITAVESL